jgi:hypothetical protein
MSGEREDTMSFWELFSLVLIAVGLGASVLGAWVTYAARWNGERTRELIRTLHADTQQTLGLLGEILERMDQRADERQREVISAIQALRG